MNTIKYKFIASGKIIALINVIHGYPVFICAHLCNLWVCIFIAVRGISDSNIKTQTCMGSGFCITPSLSPVSLCVAHQYFFFQ